MAISDFFSGGNTPDYLSGLLDDEQLRRLKANAQQNAMLQFGLSALAQGGYSPTPVGIGEILGKAGMAGMQGYQQGIQSGIEGIGTRAKLEEMQRVKKQRDAEDLFRSRIGQPNAKRNVMTQDTMQVPAAQGTIAPNFQTQMPAPTVTQEQYFDPNVMLQEGLSSGALDIKDYLTFKGQQKADSPFAKVDPSKFTTESISRFNMTGNYADLVATDSDKGFGSGTAGASLNLLTKGSLDTPNSKQIRSSPDYALAWREVTKPQTVQTEEMDQYGNVRMVTRQVPAPPLPRNILPPIYSQQSANVLNAPDTLPTSNKSNVSPTQNVSTNNDGQPSIPGGVKSSPLTRSQTELGLLRTKIDSAEQLQASLADLVDFTKKNPDPALWGVGEVGGELASKYEDVLTELRLAAELGVLNKEDLPRLMKQLPNPTDLQTWIKGGGTLSSFYGATNAQNAKLKRDIARWSKYVNPTGKAQSSSSTQQDLEGQEYAKQLLKERKKARKGSQG